MEVAILQECRSLTLYAVATSTHFIDQHPHQGLWSLSLHSNLSVCQTSFSSDLQNLQNLPSESDKECV